MKSQIKASIIKVVIISYFRARRYDPFAVWLIIWPNPAKILGLEQLPPPKFLSYNRNGWRMLLDVIWSCSIITSNFPPRIPSPQPLLGKTIDLSLIVVVCLCKKFCSSSLHWGPFIFLKRRPRNATIFFSR